MEITYENETIIIRIPCSEEAAKAAAPSKSGKTRMIASTQGFTTVVGSPDGVKISLNVIGKL